MLVPGGRLVVNAIRKERGDQGELLRLDYATHLWMEREIKSVANVARADVRECLALAAEHAIRPTVEELPLDHATDALRAFRSSAAARGCGSVTALPKLLNSASLPWRARAIWQPG